MRSYDQGTATQAPKASGTWHTLHLQTQSTPARPDAPLLEFVLHNGNNEWARAASGGCVCSCHSSLLDATLFIDLKTMCLQATTLSSQT